MADQTPTPKPPVLDLGFDAFLSELSTGFDDKVKDLNKKLQEALDLMQKDPSNPAVLASYQAALSTYTLYRNAQSNTVKVYKDIASAIITNFR